MPSVEDLRAGAVAVGSWLYGEVRQPVWIISLPYDYWHAVAEADGRLEPGEAPLRLNADGMLLYVHFEGAQLVWSGGCQSVAEAKAVAEREIGAPIEWRA